MDRRQKSTLRKYQLRLADGLILDEDFYAALRQNKLFSSGMVAAIRAMSTESERVHKMLDLLTKRGPDAFDKFLEVLRQNFNWLADMLEEGYAEVCQEYQDQDNDDDQTSPKTKDDRTDSFEETTNCTSVRQTYSSEFTKRSATTVRRPHVTPTIAQPLVESTPQVGFPWPGFSLSVHLSLKNDVEQSMIARYPFDMAQQIAGSDTVTRPPVGGSQQLADNHTIARYPIDIPQQVTGSDTSGPLYGVSPRKTLNVEISTPRQTMPHGFYPTGQITHATRGAGSQDSDGKETEESEDDNDVFDGCPASRTDKMPVLVNAGDKYIPNGFPVKQDKCCENKAVVEDDEEVGKGAKGNIQNKSNGLDIVGDHTKNFLLREVYKKVNRMVNQVKDSKERSSVEYTHDSTSDSDDSTEVSLERVDDLIDELDDLLRLQHKTVEKCYKVICKRDQKLSLDMCIQNLNDEIRVLAKNLKDEKEKSNKMADDMYKLTNEGRTIEKFKGKQLQLEQEKAELIQKCKDFEKTVEEYTQKIAALQSENQDLQKYRTMVEEHGGFEQRGEERRAGRRLGNSNRRMAMALAHVNRTPGLYPSSGPRPLTTKTGNATRHARNHAPASKFRRH